MRPIEDLWPWLADCERLFVSFSGGKTSALMARILKASLPPRVQTAFIFANTGEEDDRTLDFVDYCDREFDLNLVWVESVVHHGRRKGSTHRVVSYETAHRRRDYKTSPFGEVCRKYGIPNPAFPHCTRELKLTPMTAYVRQELGWDAGSYYTALGIRADEIDRMNSRRDVLKLVYPLVPMQIKKPHVNAFWSRQSVTLEVPEHRGNCVTCWKKTDRKLFTLAQANPHDFDNFAYYETLNPCPAGGPRRFFRKERDTTALLKQAATAEFKPFTDPTFSLRNATPDLDLASGCTDSCDIYAEGDE